MGNNGNITEKQEQYLFARLHSRTKEEACEKIGITPRCARMWMQQPAMQARLAEMRQQNTEQSSTRLSMRFDAAIDGAYEIAENKNNTPYIRSFTYKYLIEAMLTMRGQDIQARQVEREKVLDELIEKAKERGIL